MRPLVSALTLAVVLSACADEPMPASPDLPVAEARTGPAGLATYEIVVENLTGGQPFTPPLAVIHRQAISLFEVGAPASMAISQVAENGNLGPLSEFADGSQHVEDHLIALGDPPPVLPGASRTFTLRSTRGAKYLSFVSMLICTNDGFTGVNDLRLPDDPGESIMLYAGAYDAGSEMNTESFDDLVPPCGPLTGVDSGGRGTGMSNPALAEGGVVRMHPGIAGTADLLPEIHRWDESVLRVTVTRVD